MIWNHYFFFSFWVVLWMLCLNFISRLMLNYTRCGHYTVLQILFKPFLKLPSLTIFLSISLIMKIMPLFNDSCVIFIASWMFTWMWNNMCLPATWLNRETHWCCSFCLCVDRYLWCTLPSRRKDGWMDMIKDSFASFL